jgi:NAD(P)-dependent dehydrogenase (short-subunit alcohol dehydrogenase family)
VEIDGMRSQSTSSSRSATARTLRCGAVPWTAPDLHGTVALVTGATRGVGKGVALVLGECGAEVYVTGRSTRTRARTGARGNAGTVEDTADEVTARGGRGIPAPTDHTDDAQTAALFARVHQEQGGRLDLLVANAWGGYEGYGADFGAPFWEQPLWRWDAMFTGGLRAQFAAARAAAPAMIANQGGLIVVTGGTDLQTHYLGSVPYDVVKAAASRLVTALAHELRVHRVTAVGIYPGFTRTEAVVQAFAEQGRQPPPETHSPEFVGRAVAAVLADSDRHELSGSGVQAATLAARYGFADIDGRAVEPFALPDEYRLRPP